MTGEKKKIIKMNALEKDLLIIINKGKTPNWFSAAHNISSREIAYSVERLAEAGYIERVILGSDEYALTSKGYEKIKKDLNKKFKLIEDEKEQKKEVQKSSNENSMTYIDGDKNQVMKLNTKTLIKPVQINIEETPKTESILDKILEEKNRKRQTLQSTKTTNTNIQKITPIKKEEIVIKKTIETREQSNEKCELCKGKFSNSVSDSKNRVYGHCFCGASYHEECYNTIITTDQKCFRCGRKIKEINDKAVEAVKDIKDVFG